MYSPKSPWTARFFSSFLVKPALIVFHACKRNKKNPSNIAAVLMFEPKQYCIVQYMNQQAQQYFIL